MDDDPAISQRVRERVVLLPGALDPEHVIEQQLVHVGRGQPLQLEIGSMQDDLLELPDLGPDVELQRWFGQLGHPGPPHLCASAGAPRAVYRIPRWGPGTLTMPDRMRRSGSGGDEPGATRYSCGLGNRVSASRTRSAGISKSSIWPLR